MISQIKTDKELILEDAIKNNKQLPVNEVDFRFWPNWNKMDK